MTPGELRAAAKGALTEIHGQNALRVYSVAEVKRIVYSLIEANDRLADVIEWAAGVPQVEKYPTFTAGWEEAALHVLDIARGEVGRD